MARLRPLAAPPPPEGLQPFPPELRSWPAFARAHGIADAIEAYAAWRAARMDWLARHGYADGAGWVDWRRFHHEHPGAGLRRGAL